MTTVQELDGAGLRSHADQLAEVLRDCVQLGASVGFRLPFSLAAARAFWLGLETAVAAGERRLFVLRGADGRIDATLQLVLAAMPNGLHRAELSKMLVHSRARRRGLAQRLLAHAEAVAVAEQRSLLVLDTCSGEPAEQLYRRRGYQCCGQIPDFASMPDGSLGATTFLYKRLPRVTAVDPDHADAQTLLAELEHCLQTISGDASRTRFQAEDVRQASARFVLAHDGQGMPLGCGALRPLEAGIGEIKRMYARPGSKGVGSAVLAWLEAQAAAIGYRALRLETRVVNTRAMDFYLAHGYRRIANYAHYAGNAAAACFEKRLPGGGLTG